MTEADSQEQQDLIEMAQSYYPINLKTQRTSF